MKNKQLCMGGVLLIVACLLVSGCWDRRELQDRNFVMAVGIDAVEQRQEETPRGQAESNAKYQISLQVLRVGGGQSSARTYVISEQGQSIFAAVRSLLSQSSKSLWFEHVQSIIISEQVLKQAPLETFLDFFRRDAEMRWRIKVFVTPGQARELLEYQPPSGEAGGVVFANSIRMHGRVLHIAGARTDLGFIVQELDSGIDVIIPRIEKAGDTVKIGGVAAFRHNQFVGYLDEAATAGIKIIRGTEQSGIIRAPCPHQDGGWVVFQITRHHSEVKPQLENGQLRFLFKTELSGGLSEVQECTNGEEVNNAEFATAAEQAVEKEVARLMRYGARQTQLLGIDCLNLGGILRARYPQIWQQYQNNWPQTYAEIIGEPQVTVHIQYGGEGR